MNDFDFIPGVLWALGLVNLAAFCLCGFDKWCAVHQKRRVPERTLLTFCALGGSPAFWCGMQIFRHKTRKPKFFVGVPLIFVLQLGLLACFYYFREGFHF